MDLIKPGDPSYDEARAVFNAVINKKPAVIAQCGTPDDVVAALQLAEGSGYEVAVRAGGHSVAGVSVNDGGLVVDVRPMKDPGNDPFSVALHGHSCGGPGPQDPQNTQRPQVA